MIDRHDPVVFAVRRKKPPVATGNLPRTWLKKNLEPDPGLPDESRTENHQ